MTKSQLKTTGLEREYATVVRDELLQISLLVKDMDTLYDISLIVVQFRNPFIPTRRIAVVLVNMFPWSVEEPEAMLVDRDRQQTGLAVYQLACLDEGAINPEVMAISRSIVLPVSSVWSSRVTVCCQGMAPDIRPDFCRKRAQAALLLVMFRSTCHLDLVQNVEFECFLLGEGALVKFRNWVPASCRWTLG